MRNLYNPSRWYAVIPGAGEKETQDVFHPYGVPFSTHPKGEWVLWTDYQHLLESYKVLQERESRQSVLSHMDSIGIEQLKAEVERLTKAGDAMAKIIKGPAHGPGEWDGEWDNWQEAKKGGHS